MITALIAVYLAGAALGAIATTGFHVVGLLGVRGYASWRDVPFMLGTIVSGSVLWPGLAVGLIRRSR